MSYHWKALFPALLISGCTSPPRLPPGGEVTFSGFAERALSDFRVIPEEGTRLRTPTNGPTYPTDGLFYRHARPGTWYKIPDHCRSSIRPSSPTRFTDTPTCDPAGMVVQKFRGQPAEPAFVPHRGATGHPAANPF